MAIPARAVLVEQLHCLAEDGLVVFTAQRWTDPAASVERPVSWCRLVRNGRTWQEMQVSGARRHAELQQQWSGLAQRYRPTALTEEQMWSALQDLTGIEPAWCSSRARCGTTLPVGSAWCPRCGRNARRVAGGAMTAARRRGNVMLDLRKQAR